MAGFALHALCYHSFCSFLLPSESRQKIHVRGEDMPIAEQFHVLFATKAKHKTCKETLKQSGLPTPTCPNLICSSRQQGSSKALLYLKAQLEKCTKNSNSPDVTHFTSCTPPQLCKLWKQFLISAIQEAVKTSHQSYLNSGLQRN